MISYKGSELTHRACRECGASYLPTAKKQLFCTKKHLNDHSNRRAMYGALLYDMFMEMRYNRKDAKGLWSVMCRLAEEWKAEDNAHRGGRKSWNDPRRYIEKNPYIIGKRGRI